MPTRKIADAERPCMNPEHNPPTHMVWEPGLYEHECPGCGRKFLFTVRGVYLSTGHMEYGPMDSAGVVPTSIWQGW